MKLTAWTVAVLLVLFTVIGYADRTVLAVAATPLMHDLHITPTQFGLLGSAFYVLFGISSILVGLLANRISPRWVLAAMALVWSLTQVPMVAVAGFGVLLERGPAAAHETAVSPGADA